MRITCPNCNAQYDVGADMIPPDGRDVQCSNCGTTWFQEGRARAASAAEARAGRTPAEAADAPPDGSPSTPGRRRPEQTSQTLDILREEREREERLRAESEAPNSDDETAAGMSFAAVFADAGSEAFSRTDRDPKPEDDTPEADPPQTPRAQAAAERARMGAAASVARTREPLREMSGRRSRGSPLPPPEDVDVSDVIAETMRAAAPSDHDPETDPYDGSGGVSSSGSGTRRDLLPDIEEINSSLRPDERAAEAEALAAAEADAPRAARRSSGFRVGFLAVCAIILVLAGIYIFADMIAQAVPQIAGLLADYVAWVDAKRVALAAGAEALTTSLSRND